MTPISLSTSNTSLFDQRRMFNYPIEKWERAREMWRHHRFREKLSTTESYCASLSRMNITEVKNSLSQKYSVKRTLSIQEECPVHRARQCGLPCWKFSFLNWISPWVYLSSPSTSLGAFSFSPNTLFVRIHVSQFSSLHPLLGSPPSSLPHHRSFSDDQLDLWTAWLHSLRLSIRHLLVDDVEDDDRWARWRMLFFIVGYSLSCSTFMKRSSLEHGGDILRRISNAVCWLIWPPLSWPILNQSYRVRSKISSVRLLWSTPILLLSIRSAEGRCSRREYSAWQIFSFEECCVDELSDLSSCSLGGMFQWTKRADINRRSIKDIAVIHFATRSLQNITRIK